ncbi:MAG: hypothetical protein MUC63_06255 [Planctomycetes bacterium]|jgi:hypothetical protein|nr:hypothetical protein [Planctomycetota bacterium]
MADEREPVRDRSPDGYEADIRESLLVAEKKLASLNILGSGGAPIEGLIAGAKLSLERSDLAEARRKADEILVFFSILSGEIDSILSRLASGEGKREERKPDEGAPPTLEEVEQTVEDAFLKHLHSTSLRRMVEVISLEKIRSVMADEEFYQKVVRKSVERALAERGGKGDEKE